MSLLISLRNRNTKGISLIESTVVLGIAGIIMAAIWGAATIVHRKASVEEAMVQILEITQNMRTLYREIGTFSGTGSFTLGTDITVPMVNAGVFPESMLTPAAPTTPRNPWNTRTRVDVGPTDLATFRVFLVGPIPREACAALAATMVGRGRPPGLVSMNVGTTAYNQTQLNTLASGAIDMANCTSLHLIFNLRG